MNADLQHRLFNYTEAPPPSAWDGIAAALDAQRAYAGKLQQYEAVPPATAWNKIAQQLEAPQATAVPLRTKLFKYAIAAAVLAVIAAGSIYYLQNGTGAHLANQPQNAVAADVSQNPLSDTQTRSNTAAVQDETAFAKINPDLNNQTGKSEAMVQFSSRVRIVKKQPATEPIDITPEVKTVIDTKLHSRYMIATTAGGKAVRLPKKAYSDYACAEALTDARCKERIAFIQRKMATSVATDFTDFVDLLKKLQDN